MKKSVCFFIGIILIVVVMGLGLAGCLMNTEEDGDSPDSAKMLTANTWTDSNIASSNGEQWFKFNLTANPQFLHVNYGTLTNVYIEMYDEGKSRIGSGLNIYGSSGSIGGIRWSFGLLSSVDVGDTVYIKVTAFSGTGTYRIAFNTTSYPPGATITTLTPNNWANGNLSSPSDEQWFKFSPTSGGTHYIHVSFDTLTDLNIRLFSANDMLSGWVNLFGNNKRYTASLSSGNVYYVLVRPNSNSGPGSGTYKIAFNDSMTSPSE
jgi:hypothetical protein